MSSQVNLSSRGGLWRRLLADNVAAATSAFGTVVGKVKQSPFVTSSTLTIISLNNPPTSEKPFHADGEEPNSVMFRFFGQNNQNLGFSARVWGLTKGMGYSSTTAIECWERVLLAQFLVTTGNISGVANTLIGASDFECDTIALTYGESSGIAISSPANDLPAWARLDHLAFPYLGIEIDESVNPGSPTTTSNILYRFLW